MASGSRAAGTSASVSFLLPLVLCVVVLASRPRAADAKSSSPLVTIDESNWGQVLDGEWMLEFYAPWCPACKSLQPAWEQFSTWGADLGIRVAQCDVTKSPGLSGRFLVTALPTIYHVKDGVFRQYQGARDKDVFISFIEDKKWENVEPVPFWQSPGSFHMTVVSEFFRFSNYLRDLHKSLVEDYGVSTWGSYALFGVTTIIVGALLGLLLVCIMDYVNPPKPLESLIGGAGGAGVVGVGGGGGGGSDADSKARPAPGTASGNSEGATTGDDEDDDDDDEDDEDDDDEEEEEGSRDGEGDGAGRSSQEERGTATEEDDDDDGEEESESAATTPPAAAAAATVETGASGDAQQPRRRPRRAD